MGKHKNRCVLCGAQTKDRKSPNKKKEKALTEQKHAVEGLIGAVRSLPPSSPRVVGEFARKVFEQANDDGTIDNDKVYQIVQDWPDGCQGGKDDFCSLNGITAPIPAVPESVVTFDSVGTAVLDGNQWLWGEMEDRRYDNGSGTTAAIFPNGRQYARHADYTLGRNRAMSVNHGVTVDLNALNAHSTGVEFLKGEDGSLWAAVKTDEVWDDNGSCWGVVIKLNND